MLKHILGMTNTRADALSRQSDDGSMKMDNNNVVVLPSTVFAKAAYTSLNNMDILCWQEQCKHKSDITPWIDHHNLHQHGQLWWKNEALIVVGNNNLKRGVIQSFHNPPSMGHPGITNTYTLI